MGYEIRMIAQSKGWKTPTDFDEVGEIATKLCLIHSEVSEALEALRSNDFDNFKEEMADVIIRTLHLCHGLDIPIDHEVEKKIGINRRRAHKHGGKQM